VRHKTLHHIRTTPGPPVTCRPRRLAPDRLAIAKAEFDAMLQDGTTCGSESSWSSALHTVPKDNGWRPCCDHRALNARIIPDRYLVRHIHDYSHQLYDCFIFSKIDRVTAYNQIPSIPTIYRRPSLQLHSAYSSSLHILRPAQRGPDSNASWTFCGDSTSVSPTSTTSLPSPGHSRSISIIYVLSSTNYRGMGSSLTR
jgi:hypothetical protein